MTFSRPIWRWAIAALLCEIAAAPSLAATTPALSAPACNALTQLDLSTVQDAPTQILTAHVVEANAKHAAYCDVEGYVSRQVGFTIRLPLTGWNGRLLMTGTGGMAGEFLDPAEIGIDEKWLDGYAYIRTDGGHRSTSHDAKWAYNNVAAVIDYSYRAAHVGSIAGKAIVARVYGSAPHFSYFEGCSAGGREALVLAQRFPWDFDGIIVGAPSMRMANLYMNLYSFAQNMRDQGRTTGLDPTALALLHKSVLAQCDALDGTRDGLLDDPRNCRVDFERVRCKGTPGSDCLTDTQIGVARRIYDGTRRPDGGRVATSSAMPGSELEWGVVLDPAMANYPVDIYRYVAFDPAPGASWTPQDLRLEDYPRRMGLVESLWSATNPDLRQFKQNGGKLIAFMGWNDALGGVRELVDYSETVERTMGGREATQDFYRLFMVPGMNHCTGGVGAHKVNYLEALVSWNEHGTAPDSLVAQHPSDDGKRVEFTRTLRPYVTARSQPDGK